MLLKKSHIQGPREQRVKFWPELLGEVKFHIQVLIVSSYVRTEK